MSAPSLAELQERLQDYLLRGAPGLEPPVSWVRGDARASAATRLAVYGDGYRLRLLEVLGNDYPALRQLAGARDFERLARAYIEAQPSDTPSVRWYGRGLPDFLRGAPYSRRPVLAELALFEWKLGEAFDAPQAAALELEAVAAISAASWPAMHFVFQPSLRRLDLRWNAPSIYQPALQQAPLPASRARKTPRPWLLWRGTELDMHWRALQPDEAAAIDAAAGGRSFGAICEMLADETGDDQVAIHAAGILKRWIVDGIVAGIELA
jgi:hypothetical protein